MKTLSPLGLGVFVFDTLSYNGLGLIIGECFALEYILGLSIRAKNSIENTSSWRNESIIYKLIFFQRKSPEITTQN